MKTEALADMAADAFDQVSRAAAPAIKKGKRQAGRLLDQCGELFDSVTSRAGETAADLGRGILVYTKKNPLSALLLAVGAGALLIGAVTSFHSRNRD